MYKNNIIILFIHIYGNIKVNNLGSNIEELVKDRINGTALVPNLCILYIKLAQNSLCK